MGYAVSDPHIARAGKGAAGDHQDVMLLCGLTEFLFIRYRRLDKQVKRAVGLCAGKAVLL